jgi:hypothetical protein
MQTKVPLSHACFARWEKGHSNRVLRGRCGLSLLSSPIEIKEERSNPLQTEDWGERVARSLPFTLHRTYLESTIQEAYERLQVFSWLQPKF